MSVHTLKFEVSSDPPTVAGCQRAWYLSNHMIMITIITEMVMYMVQLFFCWDLNMTVLGRVITHDNVKLFRELVKQGGLCSE